MTGTLRRRDSIVASVTALALMFVGVLVPTAGAAVGTPSGLAGVKPRHASYGDFVSVYGVTAAGGVNLIGHELLFWCDPSWTC